MVYTPVSTRMSFAMAVTLHACCRTLKKARAVCLRMVNRSHLTTLLTMNLGHALIAPTRRDDPLRHGLESMASFLVGGHTLFVDQERSVVGVSMWVRLKLQHV